MWSASGTAASPVSTAAHIEAAGSPSYIAPMNSTEGQTAERLPILIAPHPSLRTKARRVMPDQRDLVREIVPQMFATMYAAPGIGLAAPQIGMALRLAVVDLQPEDKPAPLVLVNPEILAASEDRVVREEGCLSLPGMYADVERPSHVRIRFEDAAGTRHELDADGLLAACLQHEIDHLDGVLFVDHLTPLRRNMILRKLAKEQKAKATA